MGGYKIKSAGCCKWSKGMWKSRFYFIKIIKMFKSFALVLFYHLLQLDFFNFYLFKWLFLPLHQLLYLTVHLIDLFKLSGAVLFLMIAGNGANRYKMLTLLSCLRHLRRLKHKSIYHVLYLGGSLQYAPNHLAHLFLLVLSHDLFNFTFLL